MSFVANLSPEQKIRATLIAGELNKLGITNKYVVGGILAVVSKESNFNRLKEISYANTDNARVRKVFGSRVAKFSEPQLTSLKKDYNRFFETVYGKDSGVRLGNNNVGDGVKYVGRGFNQLTGKGNYKLIGDKIGIDLVSNPQLMETPEIAAKAIAMFFKNNIDLLIKSDTFKARYLVSDAEKVKDAKTGVNVAYDINAGNSKQKYGDTTGGYKTSVSRVDDFVNSISEFVITNPVKTGGGLLLLALLGVGGYYLSKGGFSRIA